jgi:hypothetical protein
MPRGPRIAKARKLRDQRLSASTAPGSKRSVAAHCSAVAAGKASSREENGKGPTPSARARISVEPIRMAGVMNAILPPQH